MEGIIPEGFKTPEYDPVCDAKCFTDSAYEPSLLEPMELYNDYVHIIKKGFNVSLSAAFFVLLSRWLAQHPPFTCTSPHPVFLLRTMALPTIALVA
mmetsp:Transcript_1276/g.2715  ORF Transcript_1276/g.2715 Transcript_1276/m.2715 type:complete len:96 (-) Transcript_1276:761-1048(-)